MRTSLLFCGLCLLYSCGDLSAGRPDAGRAGDAGELSCSDRQPLAIGHCIDTTTNAPCLDFEAQTRTFVNLEGSDPIKPIIGLQGSPMFVLAVEAQGILNGENEFAPLVDLQVTKDNEFVGGYFSRPTFVESTSPSDLRAPQLYVVSFFADDLVGLTVEVQAEITDQSGQEWCHTSSFVIGELIESPSLP